MFRSSGRNFGRSCRLNNLRLLFMAISTLLRADLVLPSMQTSLPENLKHLARSLPMRINRQSALLACIYKRMIFLHQGKSQGFVSLAWFSPFHCQWLLGYHKRVQNQMYRRPTIGLGPISIIRSRGIHQGRIKMPNAFPRCDFCCKTVACVGKNQN